MTTQKKAAKTAKTTKTTVKDPVISDPINNESDIDQDLDNSGDDDDDDDFDASEGSNEVQKSEDAEHPKKKEAPSKQTTQKKAAKTDPKHYEEWMVEIKEGKASKLKKLRDNVKISDEEADTLNHGALGQGNASRHVMYFKPGQD